MIRPVKTPWIIRKWYPSLTWSRKSEDAIYLTFDDGPHPEVTRWVMSQLSSVNANATFFCIGDNVKKHPEVARELIDNGHKIGNHTYNHLRGWYTSNDEYNQNVNQASEVINDVTQKRPSLFRPPYGRIKRDQIQSLKEDFEIVMWSHLSWDFNDDVDENHVCSQLRKCEPGSILLFHDNQGSFKNLQKILPPTLRFFKSKGFKFETL